MRKIILIAVLISISIASKAQLTQAKKDSLIAIRTAENLVSGNTKDVLSSFFQLAANDLTGNNKEFKFSSSIFAIMLKTNPSLNMKQHYFNNGSFARNTNVNWAVKLDSNYKFNGASFGIKCAIINKRDVASSRQFVNSASSSLQKRFADYNKINGLISSSPNMVALNSELNRIIADSTGEAYRTMSDPMRKIFNEVVGEENSTGIPSQSMFNLARATFDSVKSSYATKPIVVLGCDLKTFKDQFLFSEVHVYLDGTGGMFHASGNDVDFDWVIKANLMIQDDSTRMARDLTRNLLNAEGGFNLVFRNKVAISTFELKLAAAYEKIFSGKYAWEQDKLFTLNGTARIRISKDLTIPMTIKYDPEHSNVLGVLSITSNFDGLANLLSGKN
jgi:hypothetical protein